MVAAVVASLAILTIAESLSPPVVTINGLHRETAPNFLGITLDSAYIDRYDLSNPSFVKLTSRFPGAILRVGGTDADRVFLQMPDGRLPYSPDHLEPLGIPGNPTYKILNVSVFDELHAFARATNTKLLWDLNALGTRLKDNTWDSTNAAQLFDHIKRQGYDKDGVLVGFQFGNEPFLNYYNPIIKGKKPPKLVTGTSLGKDLKAMQDLLAQKGLSALRVQANDACCFPTDVIYSSFFLREVRDMPNLEFSFHLYPNPPCTTDGLLKADGGRADSGMAYYQNLAKDNGFRGKVVLSETSAHNSGCGGLSDRFVHSLWWLDYLGRAMDDHGVWQIYRQSLFTPSSYGLAITNGAVIDRVTPDYYTTVLWHRLMGRDLSIDGRNGNLRVYAACTPSRVGAITLAFANFDSGTLNFSLSMGSSPYTGAAEAYRLASVDLLAQNVTLNGVLLNPDSALEPTMTMMNDTITLPGHTLGFFVLTDAASSACTAVQDQEP